MTTQKYDTGLYDRYEQQLRTALNTPRIDKTAIQGFLSGLQGMKCLGFGISKEYLKNLVSDYDKRKKSNKVSKILIKSRLTNIDTKNRYFKESIGYKSTLTKKAYNFIVI
jgi:hypothetical protein